MRCRTSYLFLLPALAVFACFVLLPMADSFWMSLYDWTSGRLPRYVGFQHFRVLCADRIFWRALFNNLVILLGSLVVQLPLAALLAILLSYPTPGRLLFRTGFFAPMVMPTIAIALLWMNLYAPVDGPATRLLQWLTGSASSCHWLSADSTSLWLPAPALGSIFITICWQYIGFHLVIFMAGLTAIPQELFEAARMDGASELQVIRHLVLPALKPTIAVSATLSIMGSLKYFDLIYLMGSAMAEEDRDVVATYIYRLAFDQGQGRFGQGSAAAVLLFLLTLAVLLPLYILRCRRRQP